MTNVEASAAPSERSKLAEMVATLSAYEDLFGPFHAQTLMLTVAVAAAYRRTGEDHKARRLLEKVIGDSARHLGPEHAARTVAVETLRDLFIGLGDDARAASVQRELLECRVRRYGEHHAETLAARARLCDMLMRNVGE